MANNISSRVSYNNTDPFNESLFSNTLENGEKIDPTYAGRLLVILINKRQVDLANRIIDTVAGITPETYSEALLSACQMSVLEPKLQSTALKLIEKGADVNANDGRYNALGYAAANGLKDVVIQMLAKGVNKDKKDFSNMTALDYAILSKHIAIINILDYPESNSNSGGGRRKRRTQRRCKAKKTRKTRR